MIDALYRYATDPTNHLVTEPGFKPKSAKWAIHISSSGEFEGIVSLGEGKVERIFRSCPELKVNGTAHPLLNTADVVTLFVDKEGEEPAVKLVDKHDFFKVRLEEAAEHSSGFRSAFLALSKPDIVKQISEELRSKKAKAVDKVTFFVNGAFPIESSDWHEWWRTRRVELTNELTAKKGAVDDMVCLVTGEVGQPLRVHPKITGLASVGGQPSGESLVGFDKSAFRSYGLEQSANAAMSEDAANAYRAALDALLKKTDPLAGMKIAHWYSGFIHDDDDPALLVERRKASTEARAIDQARQLLQRLQHGGDLADVATYQYYAMSLSGASGRVMVRDWMTGSFEELAASIARWFEDFSIAPLGDNFTVPDPLLWRVMACAKSPNESDDKSIGAVKTSLWKAAIDCSQKIPDAAVIRVLNLHRSFIVTGELDNTKRKTPIPTLYMRMGLLKAWLIRKGVPMSSQLDSDSIKEMPPKQEVAFQCGRLMAVLASLQEEALPEVDAGIIQRYYGAASSTPLLVLGRLIDLSHHHLAKLSSISGLKSWIAETFESDLGEIVVKINKSKALTKTFDLEQKTLFALGYYQQIADYRTKKAARIAAAKANKAKTDALSDATENNEASES